MFRFLTPLVVLAFACHALAATLPATGSTIPLQRMEIGPWAIPALPASTEGGFLAPCDGAILAAATDPATPGGIHSLWLLQPSDSGDFKTSYWQPTALAAPAWAATARWGQSIVCAGGIVGGTPTGKVSVFGVTAGKVTHSELPPLPAAVAGAGAAVIGQTLYVFGGASSIVPAKLEKTLWALDLAAKDGVWKEAAAFPGTGRAFFAATEQYGMLCIFGGIGASDGNSPFPVLTETWVYRPTPLEGTSERGWRRMSDAPKPTAHAVAIPLGQAQVMVLGGQHRTNAQGLLDSGASGGERAHPLLFHTLTDAWCGFDKSLESDAPIAAKWGNEIALLGSMPGDAARALTVAHKITLPRSVRNLAWIDYAVILAYFAFISSIGFYFSRKQESSAEFSLGGRKVLWWAAGISMFATGASAISFMAVPALAFATNLVWLMPLIVFIPGYFVTAYLIFPLLRRMEITSTYEYLDRRFNRTLRVIASLQCMLFQTFARASVVLVLPSLAIASVTGINVYVSVIVMGVLTTIYTAIGGFDAVIWTEVFQGLLKFFAPLVMIGICIANLPGGVSEFWQTGVTYHKFDLAVLSWDVTLPAIWILLLGSFLTCTVSRRAISRSSSASSPPRSTRSAESTP